ncbi:MAG: Plug domain-containing protein [Flavobacteriales bacterium]|nr:Plug domain-containing protein [Flavobacteriales bacterium]
MRAYVRGGGPDQNLILLDNAIVYNASHLFGFFSVFNADAVKNIEPIKGGMPANYGGRISSVLDINMEGGQRQGLPWPRRHWPDLLRGSPRRPHREGPQLIHREREAHLYRRAHQALHQQGVGIRGNGGLLLRPEREGQLHLQRQGPCIP